ncbi:MAG: diacylglycerol/lipid kinase family protein [Solirubrobacteraceae bacterium]
MASKVAAEERESSIVDPTLVRRLAAIAALLLAALAVVAAVASAIQNFPLGLLIVLLVLVAAPAAWYGIGHRAPGRVLGLGAAALLLAAALVLVIVKGSPLLDLGLVAVVALALAAARVAFTVHVRLPEADPPRRAVLFMNPRSGGGTAERFHLAREARARGIEPVELKPGEDLRALATAALERGADALAMAGGDGSQAIVADVAAARGVPYACIPAGTRNHFALDLGVDRNDVVGALDAFVDGGERRVDLAEVNGRVFVNNVSLGVYADAVQHAGYRDAKLRTLLDTAADTLGSGNATGLQWREDDGEEHSEGAAILVSNNAYRLGRALGSGTRPRLDDGVLGVTVLDSAGPRPGRRPWREWTVGEFDVAAKTPVPAGIDGEAAVLEPPLRFRTRPGALRVRIALDHPGASPSAIEPAGPWASVRALVRIAVGRTPRSAGDG